MCNKELVLASQSKIRADILKNAGLSIITHKANIDERQIESYALAAGTTNLTEMGALLALEKAKDVAMHFPTHMILGADQLMLFEEQPLHKLSDMAQLAERLAMLSGKTHYLYNGLALVKGSAVLWRETSVIRLKMRKLSDNFIDYYLKCAGDSVLHSVAGYQIENIGIQLFEEIDGDLFGIMGMPLLGLLEKLREYNVLPA